METKTVELVGGPRHGDLVQIPVHWTEVEFAQRVENPLAALGSDLYYKVHYAIDRPLGPPRVYERFSWRSDVAGL